MFHFLLPKNKTFKKKTNKLQLLIRFIASFSQSNRTNHSDLTFEDFTVPTEGPFAFKSVEPNMTLFLQIWEFQQRGKKEKNIYILF